MLLLKIKTQKNESIKPGLPSFRFLLYIIYLINCLVQEERRYRNNLKL